MARLAPGKPGPMDPTTSAAVDEVLDGVEQVYVGVSAPSGPHVTPELFTRVGGSIVCLTAATTLKVRVLRRRPQVALAAGSPGHALAVAGRAVVLDPASPTTLLRSPVRAATAPLTAARFALANAAELTGAAVDLFSGRLGGPIPPHRVLLAIEPTAAVVTHLDEVTTHWGWEPTGDDEGNVDRDEAGPEAGDDLGEAPDLDPVPDELAVLAEADAAVLGWTDRRGAPLALVAGWDGGSGRASLPAGLLDLVGASPRSAACATFDAWTRFGPSGKQGVMLRGTGKVRADGGGVACRFDRATHWDGVDTATTDLPD
jgi:hypothetical protein